MRSSWLFVPLGVFGLSGCANENQERSSVLVTYTPGIASGVITVGDDVTECPADAGACIGNGLFQTARLSFEGAVQPVRYQLFERRSDSTEELLADTNALEGQSVLLESYAPDVVKVELPFVHSDDRFMRNLRLQVDFNALATVTFDPYVQRRIFLNGAPAELTRDGTLQVHTQPFDAANRRFDNELSFERRPDETCTVTTEGPRWDTATTADRITLRLFSPIREGNDDGLGWRAITRLTVRLNCMAADGGSVVVDGGLPDAGEVDGGVPDSGAPDAGGADSRIPDAGASDAGLPDAGSPDAGMPDAGSVDAGVPAQLACAPTVYAAALDSTDRVNHHGPGGALINTFFPFGTNAPVRTAPLKRTNGSALAVLSVGSGLVTIFDQSGGIEQSFTALSGNAGSIAGCDIDFDGNDDVVLGNREGTAAQFVVRHFTGSRNSRSTPCRTTRGATSVACGRVDSQSSVPRVVVGPGYGTSNLVRVYTAQGGLISSFQPYASAFWDGVEVAVAKTNAAQGDRIITAQRTFARTEVRAFSGGGAQVGSRTVFDSAYEDGSSVTAADLDGDGTDEVIVGQRMTAANIRVLSGDTLVETGSWTSTGFTNGITLSSAPRASWQCPTAQPTRACQTLEHLCATLARVVRPMKAACWVCCRRVIPRSTRASNSVTASPGSPKAAPPATPRCGT